MCFAWEPVLFRTKRGDLAGAVAAIRVLGLLVGRLQNLRQRTNGEIESEKNGDETTISVWWMSGSLRLPDETRKNSATRA